jgi:hypothetical protein
MESRQVSQQPEAEEKRMQSIAKQVLITPRNFPRIAARIVPQDQREAIRPGIIVSHYAFTNAQGQQGYVIISHTTQRAGICFGKEYSEWGTWNEETDTITTDGGRMYNRLGETLLGFRSSPLELSEAPCCGGHD